MNTTVSSELRPGYLLLVGSGEVVSLDEYRFLARQYGEEISKYDCRKIIVDERQVAYGPSLLLQSDIIDFYEFDLGEDATDWQLAVVVGNDLIELGEFWAHSSREAGYSYRVFLSIEEAAAFLTSSSGEAPPIGSQA